MDGQFLVYSSENSAMAKAEEEGRAVHPNGWNGTEITKYVTKPFVLYAEEGQEPNYALDVSGYTTLTSGEIDDIVTSVTVYSEVEQDD